MRQNDITLERSLLKESRGMHCIFATRRACTPAATSSFFFSIRNRVICHICCRVKEGATYRARTRLATSVAQRRVASSNGGKGKEATAAAFYRVALYTRTINNVGYWAAEAKSYGPARTWCVMNGLKLAAFVNPTDEDRTAGEKNSPPMCNVRVAPSCATLFPVVDSVLSDARNDGSPEDHAANSNVKLDFRVDFSGTHRKALQASPRLCSRAEIKTLWSFRAAPTRSARNPRCPRSLKVSPPGKLRCLNAYKWICVSPNEVS